jgi:flagellar protein FlaG
VTIASRAPASSPAPAAKPLTPVAVKPSGMAAGEKGLKQLEAQLNRMLSTNLRLRIEHDEGSGNYVYMGIDKETGEVKRQWPAEEILRMHAFFRELDGTRVDKTL